MGVIDGACGLGSGGAKRRVRAMTRRWEAWGSLVEAALWPFSKGFFLSLFLFPLCLSAHSSLTQYYYMSSSSWVGTSESPRTPEQHTHSLTRTRALTLTHSHSLTRLHLLAEAWFMRRGSRPPPRS